MASTETAVHRLISRDELRTFHLTGRGLEAYPLKGSLRPAAIDPGELRVWRSIFPLYDDSVEAPQPMLRVLQNVVNAQPLQFPILRDSLDSVAGAFGAQMGQRSCASLSSVVDSALAAVRAQIESADLDAEVEALWKALPRNGWLIGFGSGTVELLACFALHAAQKAARARFVDELQEWAERLRELLALDDRRSPAATSDGAVAASLGAQATSFLEPGALADDWRRRTNATLAMNAERRARCAPALNIIQKAMADWKRLPTVVLLHSLDVAEIPAELGVETRRVDDACTAALALCSQQLEHQVTVWKALRIARLEVETSFDAETHPAALTGFDWRMAQPHELAALPAVLARETAETTDRQPGSLARLLKSGMPVQALIACPDGHSDVANLPLAYPETFALHSAVAATDHLVAGLGEMARALQPAVAMVGVSLSWSAAALLAVTRRFPLYRYHPTKGESRYERFAMRTKLATRYEGLNAAEVAALLPSCRHHFRVLPGVDNPPQAFPYVELTDDKGVPHRAMFTRELADLCDAAERNWRMLAELAAPKAVTEANPAAEQTARVASATDAIQRVIAMLTPTSK